MKRSFLFLIALTAPWLAWGWPGFTWEEWIEIAQVERPEVSAPQAGLPDLLPLREGIETRDHWETKRDAIVGVLEAFLGEPVGLTAPSPKAEELGREDLGSYERIHLRIPSEPDDSIPAYLLLPKQRQQEKAPVMIVLHQTQGPGKQEPAGMVGDENMFFAKELAERGAICIVPDAIGFGERIRPGGQPYDNALDFYRKHPKWSFFGKMNWDVSRVVDYLETLDYVDTQRIGIMGHSHGAYGAIMAAVFEPRISLALASCGFTTLRTDPVPGRWSHLTALLPRLGFYLDDVTQTPFDWHEIIACIAPRPFFNWATLEDAIFPETDNLKDVYEQVAGVYALYGTEDRFMGKLVPGPHRFPVEAHEMAYTWIDAQWGRPEQTSTR